MTQNSGNRRGQVIYFSHGGGPLPVLGDATHDKMIAFMKGLDETLHKPEAIVVFSAHWEENTIAVQSGPEPSMLYDYYGFPEEAYQLKYPCKGHPALAAKIHGLLLDAGLDAVQDDARPYDHGSYIPLMMIYPEADIPVIQVSLHHSLAPSVHVAMGEALKPLLEENILFIGSGFSFHNMRRCDFSGKNATDPVNDEFQEVLIDLCSEQPDDITRREAFRNWKEISGAKYAHPREEHLLPLHVCVGLSAGKGEKVFDDYIVGKRAVGFLWR